MSLLWRLGKWGLAIELSIVGGTYGMFHYMNTSRSFRRQVGTHCPPALDAFYSAATTFNSEFDAEADRQRIGLSKPGRS